MPQKLVNPSDLPLTDYACFYGNRLGNEAIAIAFTRENEEPGFIGWYESDPHEEISTAVLHEACRWLREKGKSTATGPMEGVTWNTYRFLIDSSQPIFKGEPEHPPWYPEFWKRAGFTEDQEYISKIFPVDQNPQDESKPSGDFEFIRITPADVGAYMNHLRKMTNQCFRINPFFAPMPPEWFNPSYQQIVDNLPEGFIRLAVNTSGNPAGFILTYPDQPGPEIEDPLDHQPRLVLKTLAVDPSVQQRGLGTALVNEAWKIARESGIPWMIYALMHSDNPSTRITPELKPHLIRRYVLMTRKLL